ncbi:MAG: alpha/beta hydrolase [Pseudopedobacter saltans]|uniref:Alpha/beta hydrolase n=1 Tax=Pseudopedobacter saltans TaxID=151895 RepID=A0A2W5EWE8_9SPHI|nr:MAG: alpha/beta hydrolase [Pseudopedobacter saltans]
MKTLFLSALSLIILNSAKVSAQNSLQLDLNKYQEKTVTVGKNSIKVRAFENIIYVSKPVDTMYEKMNIYIPEAYFENGTINGYTKVNAPIFFPNQIGGYMPGNPGTTEPMTMGMLAPKNGEAPKNLPPLPAGMKGKMKMPERINTIAEALLHGYIVASPGARGRTSSLGKAPAAIIDLKAAVRYLKYNDQIMPGDANKIISNGTSAGGAMSALLGATGNNSDYSSYLNAIGAADATDDIFAVSAYCPITNLDHADAAYEWQFNGHNEVQQGGPMAMQGGSSTLNASQIAVSNDLKKLFPAYVNSLQLKDKNGIPLTLDKNGNGSFKDLIKTYVIASANTAIAAGKDLTAHKWLTFKEKKVVDLNWDEYITYMVRQKTPPAFDALDLSTPETQEFGTDKIDKQHFTNYSFTHSAVKNATMANETIIKMMNPMYYIGTQNTTTAKNWRIRHGSKDKDGSLATPILLATLLTNKGYTVDVSLPWDRPHSGDYDVPELFKWIDTICN